MVLASDVVDVLHTKELYTEKLNADGNGTITISSVVEMGEGVNIWTNSTTGTKFGGSGSRKIGFYDATPIVQAVLATGGGATVDNVITALQNLGFVKQS